MLQLKDNRVVSNSEKTLTSDNTIFTRRAFALGPAEVRSGFGEVFSAAGKRRQPDTSAPPNRIAAALRA